MRILNTHIVAFIKDIPHCEQEQYVWMFHDCQFRDVLLSVGRMAANPQLSFSWYDAALVSMKIRKELQ